MVPYLALSCAIVTYFRPDASRSNLKLHSFRRLCTSRPPRQRRSITWNHSLRRRRLGCWDPLLLMSASSPDLRAQSVRFAWYSLSLGAWGWSTALGPLNWYVYISDTSLKLLFIVGAFRCFQWHVESQKGLYLCSSPSINTSFLIWKPFKSLFKNNFFV